MTELKPCPFCGGKALLGFSKDEHLNERHFVICENVIKCGCLTQYCNSKDKAIEKWNRRAEKDRYIKMPCKVGDTIYKNILFKDGHGDTVPQSVVGFHLGEFPHIRGRERKQYIIVYHEVVNTISHIDIKQIGKTVFLTKEEAEKKLHKLETDTNVGSKKEREG